MWRPTDTEILDEHLNPLPILLRENGDWLGDNGYNQMVAWGGCDAISHLSAGMSICEDSGGARPEDVCIYVLQLQDVN